MVPSLDGATIGGFFTSVASSDLRGTSLHVHVYMLTKNNLHPWVKVYEVDRWNSGFSGLYVETAVFPLYYHLRN